ncbi:MAG: hypothetical protein K6E40_13080 [Desulfovibrio sp.]|nr:hypothetical protein [Desulfovibrio sp.]
MNATQNFTEQTRHGCRHHRHEMHGQAMAAGQEGQEGMRFRHGQHGQHGQEAKEGGCALSGARRQCRRGQGPEAGPNGQRCMHRHGRGCRNDGTCLPASKDGGAPASAPVETPADAPMEAPVKAPMEA